MSEIFYGKDIGYADAISGVIDDHHLQINWIKKPNYTMMLITTNGTLGRSGNDSKWCVNGEAVQLKYLEIVWNYYAYQHDIDDQNNDKK